MKFQMHRADFAKLIGKIQSLVPAKPSIPILSNVLLEAEGDLIILSATDLTVSMRASAKGHVTEEGSVTLPAKRLFQLVRELTTPEIEIETTSPEVAIVKAGSSRFRVQGMHRSEFPALPDLSTGAPCYLESSALKEMLSRTAFAAARDDSRQVLNGVLMQRVNQLATFVGTDGKRLAWNKLSLEGSVQGPESYILPLKAVDELIRLLDGDEEKVKLTLMPDKIGLEVGDCSLTTKLFSGQYPDVGRVIPKKSDHPIKLHREELISLLRQVSLFTSDGNHSVRFSFTDGVLSLSATSGEIGEGKASMPVNYSGPKLEIAFNPQYFLDILRHSKDETVEFDVSDSYNPGLVTDSSKAEFVIMPMRLEQ